MRPNTTDWCRMGPGVRGDITGGEAGWQCARGWAQPGPRGSTCAGSSSPATESAIQRCSQRSCWLLRQCFTADGIFPMAGPAPCSAIGGRQKKKDAGQVPRSEIAPARERAPLVRGQRALLCYAHCGGAKKAESGTWLRLEHGVLGLPVADAGNIGNPENR